MYLFNQLSNTAPTIEELTNDKNFALQQYDIMKKELNYTQSVLKAMKHPDNSPFLLEGTPEHQKAACVVFWNKTTKAVYVDANNLPVPPGGKQYQLWAINQVGKYKSLGVFNFQTDKKDLLYRLQNVEQPKGFLVSLELPQGSQQPTEVYVRTKTKG